MIVTTNYPTLGNMDIRVNTIDDYAVTMVEDILADVNCAICAPIPSSSPTRVLDLGGFIGTTARMILHLHPNANIIAVEANLSSYELLNLNSDGGRLYTAIHAGVVGQSIDWVWSVSHSEENHDMDYIVFFEPDAPHLSIAKVEALTINQILDRAGWDTVDFIKIDIESGEYDLFAGEIPTWLKRVTNEIHIEFHRIRECMVQYNMARQFLVDAGFTCTMSRELYGSKHNLATRWMRVEDAQ